MACVKSMKRSPKRIVHGRGKEIAHSKGMHQSPEPEQEADSEKRASAPKMTQESYQAKLEATKRKLHQGYQGSIDGKFNVCSFSPFFIKKILLLFLHMF